MLRCKTLLAIPLLLFCISYSNAQQADFSATVKSGCFPLTVQFKDLSSGTNLTGWLWTFGNGNSSTLREPSAVYTQPGIYSVTLKVTNANGSDTEVKANYIVVYDEPTAAFSFNIPPNQKCAPLTVDFLDQSSPGSGSINSWNWTFGDGGTSQSKNPSYVYTSPGNYTVSLNVKNSFGCQRTFVGNTTIQVDGIEGSFTTQSESYCAAPATVQFMSTASVPNVTYEWTFGDGAISTVPSPSHTYGEGTYTAVLKVKDASGCSDTFSKTITVGSEGGVNFTMSSSKVCIGQPVTFERTVTGSVLSQEWKFADGFTSTQNTVTKSFATSGKHKVTYTALLSGKSCNSVITKEVEVVPNSKADFTYTQSCDGTIKFTNKSTDAVGYLWDFGDNRASGDVSPSHSYGQAQQYKVILKAYNALGCESLLEKVITVFGKPQASFSPSVEQSCSGGSLSGCAPFTVQFQNTSSSPVPLSKTEWDFGDGTKSTQPNPLHTFTQKGTYTISLLITTPDGCTSSTTSRAHVADVSPVAKFVVPKTTVCAGEALQFDDQSANANYLCWTFGDGSSVTGLDPTHKYMVPGKYTVTLVAKNDGCMNTFTLSEQITVLDPLVDFDITKTCNEPYKVSLSNGSANYDAIQWTFGDGTPPTQDPNHTYAAVGNYTIEVTASNASTGCTVKVTEGVLIQDVEADFTVDNQQPCLNEQIAFTDASQAATRWQWEFGDGAVSGAKNPVKKFVSAGNFDVTLTVTDSEGCEDTKVISDLVRVLAINADFEFDAVSTCEELAAEFTDQSTAVPAITGWQWNFGDGGTSTAQNPAHTFTNTGKYTITLTLENADGNCTVVREDLIDFKNPVPEFSLKKPGFCIGESIEIVNNSQNTLSYLWIVNNIPVSIDESPVVILSSAGSFDVSLLATDEFGCTRTNLKAGHIVVTKPVPDFEAIQTSAECPPLVTTFKDKSIGVGINAWSWNFGDLQKSQLQNPTNTYTKPGTFDVSLIATDQNGCKGEAKKASIVSVGGPFGTYTISSSDICVGDVLHGEVQSENTAIHRWDFGDGTVVDDPDFTISHQYKHASNFILNLVFIDVNGCKVIADNAYTIRVSEMPEAEFTYEPKYPFEEDPLYLYGIQDSHTHQWREGDQVLSDEKDATLTLSPGYHDVTLVVTNDIGCAASVTQTILVQGDLTFIPNVFTPNDDPLNPTFNMLGLENGIWRISIVNRWGRLVYESSQYTGDWRAENEPSGVYYYHISNVTRPEKAYKGWVHVVKER